MQHLVTVTPVQVLWETYSVWKWNALILLTGPSLQQRFPSSVPRCIIRKCSTRFHWISMESPGCWLWLRWYDRYRYFDRSGCLLGSGQIRNCQSWGDWLLSKLCLTTYCQDWCQVSVMVQIQHLTSSCVLIISILLYISIDVCEKSAQFEESVLTQLRTTLSFRDDRYEVCLPRKPGKYNQLQNNAKLTQCRLDGLSHRLDEDPVLQENYNECWLRCWTVVLLERCSLVSMSVTNPITTCLIDQCSGRLVLIQKSGQSLMLQFWKWA